MPLRIERISQINGLLLISLKGILNDIIRNIIKYFYIIQ
jgi:hypothetical protein